MIFYTADLHFHYEPFLPSRPFGSVEEMDRVLIARWNAAVSEDDTVYVVGDVGYNRGLVPGDALARLRGHKHLIRGNHDTGFENAGELYRYFETVTDFNEIDDGEVHIILCHYPILYRRRGYMIHGHLHQTRGPEYGMLRQMPYFPEEVRYLPTFGQFYGSKANLNMESLIDARPQIIIDLGDKKDSIADDMDRIQKQTGIPTVFIEADLDDMAAAYRMLGDILNRAGTAEPLAQFIEKSVTMAQENSAKIPESQRLSVLFGTGSTGLACNAAGSVQADIIDLVGAVNAIIPQEVSNRGGGTTVSLEEVYAVEPDVILLSAGGPYDTLAQGEWAGLRAVQSGKYYEIPGLPYDWMSSPPSVNRVLGIWWLGNLLYPELYDYDMVQVAREYYGLFWHYDLTEEEARQMLSRSTLK